MRIFVLVLVCISVCSLSHSQDKPAASDTKNKPAVASVKPGINDNFLDPDLKVDEWIARFEVESREVYQARDAVMAACDVKPGDAVADVGAGTGLYTRLFSKAVGDSGKVYAVDISPKFVQHLDAQIKEAGNKNITTVLCTSKSTMLPPSSVDLVYVCDTYHHFEFPAATLASIYRALKPGGRLVVIDFDRIEGKSRDWLITHVRAGKATFRDEIKSAGFSLKKDVDIESFDENYFLMFEKPASN
ncbi:class I SAM-dependent methyltransferase [Planctomycetes bacterium K23_9]|uniref:Ubiquinone/menaquinone biosynthesis C-methyltransferase UbiE n=1 Tax=Stieleria marina TaxID=1930275 RepID=A0A517P0T3_9BACT|nr:Ubiquinone/menaquinone biosynthesis C-methyltransferase UbiE [Planctomycetes bacterium K23_9]